MGRDPSLAMRQTPDARGLSRPNSDGKREQITAAALDVMVKDGVFGLTTRKIADAAGVSVATLHYHFRDKDEILLSVMETFVQTYRAALAEQVPPTQTLDERIAATITFICGEIKKGPAEQLLLHEMTVYMLRHPALEHLAKAKDLHFQALYTEALSRFGDAAALDAGQIGRLSNLVYTGLVGIFGQWLATQDMALFDRSADDLVQAAQDFARLHLGLDRPQ